MLCTTNASLAFQTIYFCYLRYVRCLVQTKDFQKHTWPFISFKCLSRYMSSPRTNGAQIMFTESLWITLKKSVLLATKSAFFSSSSFPILLKSWKQAYSLTGKINPKTFFILLSNYAGIFAVEYQCCNIHTLCSRGQELPRDICAKHTTGCHGAIFNLVLS